MPEITEADREQALKLAEALDGAVGPATALRIIERFLAGLLSGTQYRAALECTQDPCTYCRSPRRRFRVEHPDGPFPTEDAAREHGRAQARLVYGYEHRVIIESRPVGTWTEVTV